MKKSFKENIKLLPPLPSSIIELNNLKKQKDVSKSKITSIIKKSPMIMADILKIVNSDMFDFKGSIDNIGEAISVFDNSFIIEPSE